MNALLSRVGLPLECLERAVGKYRPLPQAIAACDLRVTSLSNATESRLRRTTGRPKLSYQEPPSAPLATEPSEPPGYLREYLDEGQGTVAVVEGFEPVRLSFREVSKKVCCTCQRRVRNNSKARYPNKTKNAMKYNFLSQVMSKFQISSNSPV